MASKTSKPKRLERILSNLGYCSRSEASILIHDGRVSHVSGDPLSPSSRVTATEVLFEGDALDPEQLHLVMHKPQGYVCTRSALEGETVFELLPPRYAQRNPPVVTVGRLDKDTTGLLLLTDDGEFVHRVTSPRRHVPKVYEVRLEASLRGGEKELIERGGMLLEGESVPLAPAKVEVLEDRFLRVILHEGRYHQVKRMWEYFGNRVVSLHRSKIGELTVEGLAPGELRALTSSEIDMLRG